MVVIVHILYLFSHCVSFALLIIDFIVILHVGPTFDTCSIKDQSINQYVYKEIVGYNQTEMSDLPLEMLEAVLMRTFLTLYSSDFEGDDDRCPHMSAKSKSSERHAFTQLASMCSCWHYTLIGWPQSPTPDWVKHQLKKLVRRECTCTWTHNGFISSSAYVY